MAAEAERQGRGWGVHRRLRVSQARNGPTEKHEDELDFFAREKQSRRVLLGPWRGLPIWLYGVLSDYGRSYARPFLWLLVVAAIGAMLLVFSDALTLKAVAAVQTIFGTIHAVRSIPISRKPPSITLSLLAVTGFAAVFVNLSTPP
jgi:hypothetical protein